LGIKKNTNAEYKLSDRSEKNLEHINYVIIHIYASSNKYKACGNKLYVNYTVELNYNYSINDNKVENMIAKVLEELKTFVNEVQKLAIKLKLVLQGVLLSVGYVISTASGIGLIV